MKTKLISLFLMFILKTGFSQDSGIRFYNDIPLDSILLVAKKENKLVFLDCYATWCPPCKVWAKNIFTQKNVGDYFNSNFINVKYDAEKGEGANIYKKYNLDGYPNLFYLNDKGEIVHKYDGVPDANQLIENAKCALSPDNWKSVSERIEKGDYSIANIRLLLDIEPQPENMDTLLNRYYSLIDSTEKLSERSLEYFYDWTTVTLENDYTRFFLRNRHYLSQKYGAKIIDERIRDIMAYCIWRNNCIVIDKAYYDKIDSLIFKEAFLRQKYFCTVNLTNDDPESKVKWDNFMQSTIAMMDYKLDTLELLSIVYKIYMNYKKFNDLKSLEIAKKWSSIALAINPTGVDENDCHAHVLFELGLLNEAMKYEDLALKYEIENSGNKIQYYKDEIERFKKRIN